MKKSVKYIIAAAVIVIIAFLYAHVGKKVPVYDKSVDSSLYGNMVELTADLLVQQEFTCEKPVLSGISIMCATYGNTLTSTYQYQILDAESKEPLRSGILDASAVANGKYYTIKFDEIKDCRGQKFIFTLCSQDAASGNALTVYNVPKGEEDAELHLNADDFPNNTLALRTVSDMFDVETFVSVMFCLAYLYIFIIILYKFFS